MNYQKVIKKKKIETEESKIMDKYSQLKSFHQRCQLQVYMYAFMYVDTDTLPMEDMLFENYKKCQLQDQSKNIGLDFVTYVDNIMS